MKKLCLTISLGGIFLLLLLINFTEPKTMNLSSINRNLLHKQVKIKGQIINIKTYKNNFTPFTIKDKTDEIQAICSCPNLKENQKAEIIGIIQIYQDKLQINVKKIALTNNP